MEDNQKKIIVRRQCDVAMAEKKDLLPCEKKCAQCIACIEVDTNGNREHYFYRER